MVKFLFRPVLPHTHTHLQDPASEAKVGETNKFPNIKLNSSIQLVNKMIRMCFIKLCELPVDGRQAQAGPWSPCQNQHIMPHNLHVYCLCKAGIQTRTSQNCKLEFSHSQINPCLIKEKHCILSPANGRSSNGHISGDGDYFRVLHIIVLPGFTVLRSITILYRIHVKKIAVQAIETLFSHQLCQGS